MLTSKYIAHFLEEVSTWQKKLSTADQVIAIWFEVQRTWSHLESIFIGSEDIRKQLPEDSKRFDDIDENFKVCTSTFCTFIVQSVIRVHYGIGFVVSDTHVRTFDSLIYFPDF